ncbi:MAG: extracellular solute-binding protein [Clostridia bacterium]|nr:extracellular solute-binding protein [Clostridia bacterium]
MINYKKVSACALAATMVLGMGTMMSACTNKGGKGEVISASDNWYNTTRITLKDSYDPADYELIQHDRPLVCGDKYVVLYAGLKKMPANAFTDPNFDYNSYLVSDLVEFDKDGNEIRTLHMNDVIAKSADYVAQVTSIVPSEKGVGIYYINQNAKAVSFDVENTYAEIDLETGELIGEPKVLDLGKSAFVASVVSAEGYDCLQVSDETISVVFFKDGQQVSKTDFDKDIGKDKVQFIDSMYGNGAGKLLVQAYSDGDTITLEVDPQTGKSQKVDSNADILKKHYTYFEGNEYSLNSDGIKKLNASGEEEDFILFDDCNINRSETTRGEILSATESGAILACTGYQTDNYFEQAPTVIYTFEKADSNPNEGKKVIKVANLNTSLSYNEAEGLRVFNETNKDCFAKVVTYDVDDYMDSKTTGDSEQDSIKEGQGKAQLANALAVELMSGDGPDVILGAAGYAELFNEEYLVDLTTYVGGDNGLDTSKYFTNIIDASKEDGKLFYIPNAFVFSGIVCDKTTIPSNAVGLTLDQYKSFVADVCNGEDPYTTDNTRLEFFEECLSNCHESMVKDGKVNFDQQEFRDLANFFKDSIPEHVENGEEDLVMGLPDDGKNAYVATIGSLSTLALYSRFGENTTVIGLPSSDGRGPAVMITDSISISAKSDNKDGAWEFVKTMSSDEVLRYADANPLNKEALDTKLQEADKFNTDYYNLISEASDTPISDEDLPMYGLYKPNSGLVESYKASIESASAITTCDNEIMSIVIEEIQPFFEGQKDLDSVIEIINNRAQTVLDERK